MFHLLSFELLPAAAEDTTTNIFGPEFDKTCDCSQLLGNRCKHRCNMGAGICGFNAHKEWNV